MPSEQSGRTARGRVQLVGQSEQLPRERTIKLSGVRELAERERKKDVTL